MESRGWRFYVNKLKLKRLDLLTDIAGVTALEYGIIASLLGLVLVSIFQRFGTQLSTLFTHVGTAI
jgi:Flp pilus assembly pilin Flp